ncbi:hypothetical protein TcG_10230 [Trypanosoma cruzi]|nr:hypothetical protein TcG_10230 [Trypanosoma cruzi]
MHEVLPAPYIIRDARTLNEHKRHYAPLGSTRSPLTILNQSSPWAMHEEHHGKNAQKLACNTPTHSASINGVASCLGFTRILACASLRGLPYTSHVVTVKKKQRLLSDRHPAAEIKAQSNKMPQIVTYSTQTIKRLCSKCTARKKSHAHKEATQRHSKRVGKSSTHCHSLRKQMITAPNNAKHQSGTTYGPQTHPPIHSSSSQWRGPPAPPETRLSVSYVCL